MRNLDEPDDGSDYFHHWLSHDVAIFFVSYYVLMVWVLVQMVVAVILDQVPILPDKFAWLVTWLVGWFGRSVGCLVGLFVGA